jgi:hypothetical protein
VEGTSLHKLLVGRGITRREIVQELPQVLRLRAQSLAAGAGLHLGGSPT